MSIKNNQSGFAHFLIVLVIFLVLGVVGYTGYSVLTKDKEDPKSATSNTDFARNDENNGLSCPTAAIADAKGAFTELPFDVSGIRLVTLGKETNDPRFVYPWVKEGQVDIFAPADGVLFKIRHKVFEIGDQKGDDYDIFFQVDCGTVYRFNHVTDPREDIKSTYPAGELASGDYANGGLDIPERVIPNKEIRVKAGEKLGSTSGTPIAKNFDFAVGIAKEAPQSGEPIAVCPFEVFSDPNKTTLLNLLGPKNGVPTPGYPCDIEATRF